MAKLEGVKVLDMKDGEVTKIEYEGEVYTKKVERKPKPGDKIRIINAHEITGGEYKNGDILTVKDAIIEHVKVEEHDIAIYLSEFEFVDDSGFKAGDFAKVIGGTFWGNIEKGTIVKITDEADYHDDIRFETLNGDNYDYAKAESLEKVNPTERELTFLRAGRNIDEFKEGDVVEVLEDNTLCSINKAGDIGVIKQDAKDHMPYKVTVSNREDTRNWHKADTLKLVAPVESRVDLIGEKADA